MKKIASTKVAAFVALACLSSVAAAKGAAQYKFDCGDYGAGSMTVEKDSILNLEVRLENLVDGLGLAGDTTLSYHLHTTWDVGALYSTDQCGADFTGGHYDPAYHCGAASEANKDPKCDGVDYSNCSTESPDECELGDLSGKFGNLQVEAGGTATTVFEQDDMVAVTRAEMDAVSYQHDFVEDNNQRDPALWSSIVFHDVGQSGKRVLCCKVVPVEEMEDMQDVEAMKESKEEDSHVDAAQYQFDCGYYGAGSLAVEKDSIRNLEVRLRNLVDGLGLMGDTSLTYHLHTTWGVVDDTRYSTEQCGAGFTGGHYDPAYHCGPASEAKDDPRCEGTDYSRCSPESPEECELGDLSGKFGKLQVEASGTATYALETEEDTVAVSTRASAAMEEAVSYQQDFIEDNAQRDPELWSSIVFHDVGQSGKRVLCCKVVPVEEQLVMEEEDTSGAAAGFLPLALLLSSVSYCLMMFL